MRLSFLQTQQPQGKIRRKKPIWGTGEVLHTSGYGESSVGSADMAVRLSAIITEVVSNSSIYPIYFLSTTARVYTHREVFVKGGSCVDPMLLL